MAPPEPSASPRPRSGVSPRPRPAGPDTPFGGPIALALSGGGFRAAAFHLGVLSVLERAGLLPHVRVLAASSAGSIVGARLLLGLARDEDVDTIVFALRRYLVSAHPHSSALAAAAKERIPLVRAFANELDRDLFHDPRRPVARMQDVFESRTSIEEGSFGAVSLRTGRPFRFSFSRTAEPRVGQKGAQLPRRVAEDLRLADVVAATCALPGIFEPLRLPTDFDWSDDDSAAAAAEALGGSVHPLADGGLHDNLAIDGLLVAAQRAGDTIGLYLASDGSRAGSPSPAPSEEDVARRGFLTARRLDALCALFCLGALASAYLVVEKARQEHALGEFRIPGDAIAYGVPVAFSAATIVFVLLARRIARQALGPLLAGLDRTGRKALGRMPLRAALGTLHARVRTLGHVATTTLPRRLRGLVYRGAWSEGHVAPRRVAVQAAGIDPAGVDLVDNLYAPSADLVELTERAAASPTALELEGPEDLEALLVAGQAAAIVRLVEQLEMRHGAERSLWPAADRAVGEQLVADWDRLNTTRRSLRPRRDD